MLVLAVVVLVSTTAWGQVPVALAPVPHMQFFSATNPSLALAGGRICTYNAGTTTPAATYVDINGVIQNTNPIILDSSGFATIYLANQEYKFAVYDGSGNTACPNSGVQQWTGDNISAFQVVVGTQTIIFAGVTSDPAGQAGQVDYRTDLGRLRFFNSAWDSVPGLATIDIFSNKTIDISANTLKNSSNTAGHYPRNNGAQYVDGTIQTGDLPPTLSPTLVTQSFTNAAVTGTTTSLLAKLTGAPSTAVTTAITDTGGAIGICVSGCGTAGSAQISMVGQTPCVFDGATVAGDYAQISSSVAGNCHDAGSNPIPGQLLGRVLSTNGGGGTYALDLFPAEIKATPGIKIEYQNNTAVSVSNTAAETTLMTSTLLANELSGTQYLEIFGEGNLTNTSGGGVTVTIKLYLDSNLIVSNSSGSILTGNNIGWRVSGRYGLVTGGVGGTIEAWGEAINTSSTTNQIDAGNVPSSAMRVSLATVAFDTTATHVIKVTTTMTQANANDVTTQRMFHINRIG